MKRIALLAGTALIGLILAVLLLPRPDTGGEVTVKPLPPKPVAVAMQPGTLPVPAAVGGSDMPKVPAVPTVPADPTPPEVEMPKAPTQLDWKAGANPRARELQEKQQSPEALQSGKAAIPWTLIRRNLLRLEDADAKELGTEANQLMLDLRRNRRDPDTFDYSELEQRQRALIGDIRQSSYMSDPEIAEMVVRLEEILDEY